MNLSTRDLRLLHRFLDGAMVGDEVLAFRARVEAEPHLRQELQSLQQQQRAFQDARQPVMVAPAGFTAGVLAAVRRLPNRTELQESGLTEGMARFCRRLLIAAALLFGLGAAWHVGVFGDDRADTLQAAPGDVKREMDRLDALIQAAGSGTAGSGPAGAGSSSEVAPGVRGEQRRK